LLQGEGAALKIGCPCFAASDGPNPFGELPLFPRGLFVQQPHVFVSGYGVLHA